MKQCCKCNSKGVWMKQYVIYVNCRNFTCGAVRVVLQGLQLQFGATNWDNKSEVRPNANSGLPAWSGYTDSDAFPIFTCLPLVIVCSEDVNCLRFGVDSNSISKISSHLTENTAPPQQWQIVWWYYVIVVTVRIKLDGGRNAEIVNIRAGGKFCYHCALKGYVIA
jgi:hypothetical protein